MSGLVTEPPLPAATRARIAVPFILVTLMWGSTWLVIRGQLGVTPPSWSVTYRFLIAAAAMFVVARWRGERLLLPWRGQLFAATFGCVIYAGNFNLVYRAEQHVTSGLVAVVFALLVVPNAILSRIFLGSGVSRRFLIGSAVALGGIALLFAHELSGVAARPREILLGIVLTLGAVLAASVANVMQGSKRARALPVAPLIAWGMTWGALADGAFAWTTVGPPVLDPRPAYVAGLLYLSLFASALAFTLYFNLIRAIGAARAAYTSVLVPILAMTLSTLFEGYRWSVTAGAGVALVLAGLLVALSARSPSRQEG